MKILCTIILFKPNIDKVKSLLKEMSVYVSDFFLWDNTPGGCGLRYIMDYPIRSSQKGGNIGLSKSYNEALKYARTYGFDYLMTMDQDSLWVNLDSYMNQISNHERIKQFKTLYFASTTAGNATTFSAIYSGGINSGAIIPISFLNEIGGYNTDFFVDAIDDWLILEATKHEMKCYLVGNCHIVQKFGEGAEGHFWGKKFRILNYSPMRLYGVMRNYFILWHRYSPPKNLKIKIIKGFFLTWFVKILLGEDNKKKKLSALLAGVYDGLFLRPSRREKYA